MASVLHIARIPTCPYLWGGMVLVASISHQVCAGMHVLVILSHSHLYLIHA